jgi:hypothetical protein
MSNKTKAYIDRMKFLADSSKPVLNESTERETLISYKKGTDNRFYGIVKENKNFYIKTAIQEGDKELKASDFTYINGLQNITNFQYSSLSEAEKNLNLKLISINESTKYKFKNGRLIKEEVEVEKKVSVDNEEPVADAPAPEVDSEDVVDTEPVSDEPMDSEEAPAEEPVADAEPSAEPMGGDAEGEPTADENDPFEEVQSLLGKLGVKIRNIELSSPNVKTILNSVIGYLEPYMDTLSQEERIEIAKSIKSSGDSVDEAYGDEEMTQFDDFMANMGISQEDDASEIASAIMTWASQFAFGENNGDFAAVAEFLTPEVIAQLKGNLNQSFTNQLMKFVKNKKAPVTTLGMDVIKEDDDIELGSDTEVEDEMDVDAEMGMDDEMPAIEAPMDMPPMGGSEVGIGLDSASKKKVTIDMKNDTVEVEMNEVKEAILRKYVKRKLEEELGIRKKPINEGKETKTSKYVDAMIKSIMAEHKANPKKK